jgi:hypothetical protein
MLIAALTDGWPKFVGEIALLAIGAGLIGFLISKVVPASLNPSLFAVLIPLLILATLAYLGSAAAGTALLILAGLAVAGFLLGMM